MLSEQHTKISFSEMPEMFGDVNSLTSPASNFLARFCFVCHTLPSQLLAREAELPDPECTLFILQGENAVTGIPYFCCECICTHMPLLEQKPVLLTKWKGPLSLLLSHVDQPMPSRLHYSALHQDP